MKCVVYRSKFSAYWIAEVEHGGCSYGGAFDTQGEALRAASKAMRKFRKRGDSNHVRID